MRILVLGDFQGNFSDRMFRKIKKEEFDLVVGVGDYTGIDEWKPFILHSLREVKKGMPHPSPIDFFGKRRFKKLLGKDRKAAKFVLRRLNKIGKPVLLIFGNGDDEWYKYKFDKKVSPPKKSNIKFIKSLKNIREMTYGRIKYNGINFVGFGGYMDIDSYFNQEEWKEEDENKVKRRIARREKSKKHLFETLRKAKGEKIFVFHYPPQGAFDIIRDRKDNPMDGKSAGIGFFRDAILKYKPKLVLCGHMHEYQGAKKIGRTSVVNPGDAGAGKYAIVEYSEFVKGEKGKKIKVKFAD